LTALVPHRVVAVGVYHRPRRGEHEVYRRALGGICGRSGRARQAASRELPRVRGPDVAIIDT
jgi:hypothetical protein